MINTSTLINVPERNGVVVKYEFYNGSHMVQIECSGEVRYIYFPDNSSALNFMSRIEGYTKLKTLEQLSLSKEEAA